MGLRSVTARWLPDQRIVFGLQIERPGATGIA
jgi:hypothetical protein